jgi:hypothetical protein
MSTSPSLTLARFFQKRNEKRIREMCKSMDTAREVVSARLRVLLQGEEELTEKLLSNTEDLSYEDDPESIKAKDILREAISEISLFARTHHIALRGYEDWVKKVEVLYRARLHNLNRTLRDPLLYQALMNMEESKKKRSISETSLFDFLSFPEGI